MASKFSKTCSCNCSETANRNFYYKSEELVGKLIGHTKEAHRNPGLKTLKVLCQTWLPSQVLKPLSSVVLASTLFLFEGFPLKSWNLVNLLSLSLSPPSLYRIRTGKNNLFPLFFFAFIFPLPLPSCHL